MSKKANPAMIGVFVVGAIVLAVVALFLFGTQQLFTKKEYFILYFQDSINGLEEGAPVKFKGVQIGQVDEILIHFSKEEKTAYVPVIIEIDMTNLHELTKTKTKFLNLADEKVYREQIKYGLRAKLGVQSYLTGLLFVEFDYYPEDEEPVFAGVGTKYKELPTVGSDLQGLWAAASEVVTQLSKVNFEEIGIRFESLLKNLDAGVQDLDFKDLNDSIISAGYSVADFFDSKDLNKMVVNVGEAAGSIEKLADDIRPGMRDFFNEGANALESVDSLLAPESDFRYKFEEALTELSGAARSIRLLADYLERNPGALIRGKVMPGTGSRSRK